MLVYAIIIFVLVTVVSLVLFAWFFPSKSRKRLQELAPAQVQENNWIKTVVKVAGPLAQLSTPDGKWEESPLRLKFIHAGIHDANAPVLFFAAKTFLPLIFALLAYAALQLANVSMKSNNLLLALLIVATIGCFLPNMLLNSAVKKRQREIFENFPDAADLMLVCVEAGLGLEAAMVRVSEEISIKSRALAEELHLTNLETRAGFSREQALHNLGKRTGVEEIVTFVSMLLQADKFGTSVGESLRVFSEDLRHKRQVRAEELAAKLPTKMLFPTVLCIFPAISAVILGPACIQIYRSVVKMMAGS